MLQVVYGIYSYLTRHNLNNFNYRSTTNEAIFLSRVSINNLNCKLW